MADELVYHVECPRCGAEAHQSCWNIQTNAPLLYPHIERQVAARVPAGRDDDEEGSE